jgi:hypothetical protein
MHLWLLIKFALRLELYFSASATVSHSGSLMGGMRLQILTIPAYISKNMGTSQDLRNSVELGEQFRNATTVSRIEQPDY